MKRRKIRMIESETDSDPHIIEEDNSIWEDVTESEDLPNRITQDNSDHSDEIIHLKRRKIRVIESETDSNPDIVQKDTSEWEDVTESEDSPNRITFTSSEKTAGPHIATNVTDPLHFFSLFCTDNLVNNIITETNNYADNKLYDKEL